MKKIIAQLLCAAILSSFMLCGCNKPAETTASSESETQTETSETVTETEQVPTETESKPEINVDNMMKVADLYASKQPDAKRVEKTFADGIRGGGYYSVNDGVLYFCYSSINGQSSIEMHITSGKREVDVTFSLGYGDKRYYGNGQAGITEIEAFIDDVIANNSEKFRVYDDAALAGYSEKIKADLPVIYSRFITIADTAFSEIGLKLEDLGVNLGSKYRSVDPKQPTSMEPVITNNYKFKNGVSRNGKTLWTAFFYDAVGDFGNMKKKGWRSAYGQQSSTMFAPSDYVQYSSSGKKDASLFFMHIDTGKDQLESCSINVNDSSSKKKKRLTTSISFKHAQKSISLGRGVVTDKYQYWVTISAKSGQYNKVFASKAAFKKYAKVDLIVFNNKGVGKSAWGKKANIAKLKKSFAADGCTYYSKDQMLDLVWEQHEAILQSIDNGMIWMNTSLADIGINWKKK